MRILSDLKQKKTPMSRKLFLYMLTLGGIILLFFAIGLLFLGNFASVKDTLSKDLSFQSDVFERRVDKYYDDLTMMGNSLSEDIGMITENYLRQNQIAFTDLNDNLEAITGLQSAIFSKLREELLKTDCSGAFVIFDATVNTNLENGEFSKTGLYFQRSTLDATDDSILLYRGIADLGRQNDIMPHRKWRLEFRTDLIPEYDKLSVAAFDSSEKVPRLLDTLTLPGTSERVMHFIVPLGGTDGTFYGFCGFEISESYFKTHFAQATQMSHLTCMLTKKEDGKLDPEDGFSAGVFNGYYLKPKGEMKVNDFGDGLVAIRGNSSYIGRVKDINICNDSYVIAVMIPRSEYKSMAVKNIAQALSLALLIFGFTFTVCIFFSRKFLAPLLKDLDRIHKQEHLTATSDFAEIDDLFTFLAEQDRLHDEKIEELRRECSENLSAVESQKAEIDRLTYTRKSEIDPDTYEAFKTGIRSLTKTERTIFDLYLSGKNAKEILEELNIKESTLKYHNHNILGKLNVSSRKQMLIYATLLNHESANDVDLP